MRKRKTEERWRVQRERKKKGKGEGGRGRATSRVEKEDREVTSQFCLDSHNIFFFHKQFEGPLGLKERKRSEKEKIGKEEKKKEEKKRKKEAYNCGLSFSCFNAHG